VTIACSGGFYVRSLAHDLGIALGIGAHLSALRRTRASGFAIGDSVPLSTIEDLETGQAALDAALLSPAAMLAALEAIHLDEAGLRRVAKGREVETDAAGMSGFVRLLDETGALVAVARSAGRPGVLHPVVVLM
jgi:tRNA pseudouridine55 synthase